jgi:tRNA(His) 5'-end guanylyltransferase
MALVSLRDRIISYEQNTDFRIMKKVPVVIVINGRSFRKVSSLLEKPCSMTMIETFAGVCIKLMQEIDGAMFAYSFNDEIVVITRNDQTVDTNAWFDNKVQKICSATASITTSEFNRLAKLSDLQVIGDPTFTSSVFAVPNITEAINVLISKQNEAIYTAVSMACLYELGKKYDLSTIKQTLSEKSASQKLDILSKQCDINFDDYPAAFKRGSAVYRIQKVIESDEGFEKIKNKLSVDMDLPNFSREPEFLEGIITFGRDIFRQ